MKKIFSIIAAVLFAGSMIASDAVIAKGTTNSYDDVKVNGKKAVKMGKSSAGGDMTITVGAGSTSLKFHAVGWKGESDQVTITAPSGVTISPTAITVQANDNVAGSEKEFTVTPEEDYEFTFAITGATDGAVFTLESAKRAIVWAATCNGEGSEGGEGGEGEGGEGEGGEGEDEAIALEINFTQGQGNWTINDVELDGIEYVWQQNSSYGMKASAYVGGANHATESWLISPAFDLSEASEATLAISHARRYGDNSHLSVKATADGENWSDLQVSAWPDGNSWSFIDAEADLSDFAGEENVKIAFVYTSTSSAAATWEIKTVKITYEAAEGPGTAIDNTTAEVKTQKVVRDGQLLIIRNGVVFNANGTIVK